jgi:uncharacterized protein YajQ (UPF0234 family)
MMPSFDVVSEVDLQETDNAVNNVKKELNTRYDFKGSETSLELDKKSEIITIFTTDDMKMRTLKEMLLASFVKRGVDTRSAEFSETEKAGGTKLKRIVKLKKGIDKDNAKKITVIIKQSGLKVQSAIMDEKVRVTGKKIDDLQTVIKLLKEQLADLPLQFVNMKS